MNQQVILFQCSCVRVSKISINITKQSRTITWLMEGRFRNSSQFHRGGAVEAGGRACVRDQEGEGEEGEPGSGTIKEKGEKICKNSEIR